MEKESTSASIRNYAIAGACLVFAFLVGGLALKFFAGPEPTSVWSQCEGDSANVFIGTESGKLDNVKCVALDREFFAEPEITIGELQKNSEEVCRFKLSRSTAEPLRFEVRYNGKTRTEVCNWQNFGGAGVD